jgi:hypothetical protein
MTVIFICFRYTEKKAKSKKKKKNKNKEEPPPPSSSTLKIKINDSEKLSSVPSSLEKSKNKAFDRLRNSASSSGEFSFFVGHQSGLAITPSQFILKFLTLSME